MAGGSWMDAINQAGHEAWALDFVGYGKSDRYPEMSQASTAHGPLGGLDDMTRQINSAIAFISRNRKERRVILVAHSAGTFAAGRFTEDHPERVGGLVLFGAPAPEGGHVTPEEAIPTEAYFDMTPQQQWDGWEVTVKQAGHWTAEDAAPWGKAWLASDPTSATRTPPSVRVPYGMMAAYAAVVKSGRLPYSPARLQTPTLVVVGEWDAVSPVSQAMAIFQALASPEKRLVVLGQGGHRLHLESGRSQLYAEIAAFLRGIH
jgi:pimeloyl-ACP methyl ester carboxylesterase